MKGLGLEALAGALQRRLRPEPMPGIAHWLKLQGRQEAAER